MSINYEQMASMFGGVVDRLATATTIEELARGLFDGVETVVNTSHAGFYFFEPTTGRLRLAVARGYLRKDFDELERTATQRHPMRVIRSGKLLHVPDTLDDPLNQTQTVSGAPVIRSRLFIPVRSGDQVVGTLGLGDVRPNAYSEQTIYVLRVAASLAGVIYSRLQALDATRHSQEALSFVVDGAHLGSWDWDIASGHVTFNKRWAEMLGYELSEVPPHVSVWEELLHPDDMPEVMRTLQAHLDGHTPYYSTEHRLRTRQGDWRWVLDTGRVLLRDADGRPLRAAGIHQDIDARKRAEQALHVGRSVLERRVAERTATLDATVQLLLSEVAQRERTESHLVDYQERLARATESLVMAEEAERRRLALEIHDGIGQELTLLRLNLRDLMRQTVVDAHLKVRFAELDDAVVGIMKAARGLTTDLSPTALYTFGLREAIEGLLDRAQMQHGLRASLQWRTSGQLGDLHETIVFGAVRELIHNAVKHAAAQTLTVSCWRRSGRLWLRVADDGGGFRKGYSIDAPAVAGPGYGLFAWRERLIGVGGGLHVRQASGRGAEVDIEIGAPPLAVRPTKAVKS